MGHCLAVFYFLSLSFFYPPPPSSSFFPLSSPSCGHHTVAFLCCVSCNFSCIRFIRDMLDWSAGLLVVSFWGSFLSEGAWFGGVLRYTGLASRDSDVVFSRPPFASFGVWIFAKYFCVDGFFSGRTSRGWLRHAAFALCSFLAVLPPTDAVSHDTSSLFTHCSFPSPLSVCLFCPSLCAWYTSLGHYRISGRVHANLFTIRPPVLHSLLGGPCLVFIYSRASFGVNTMPSTRLNDV